MQISQRIDSSYGVTYENKYKQIKPIGKGYNATVNLIEDLKNNNKK